MKGEPCVAKEATQGRRMAAEAYKCSAHLAA
ncbi:hypothetical protein COSO111634_21955 [Corallococcus soli]